jgi:hypothetical protein
VAEPAWGCQGRAAGDDLALAPNWISSVLTLANRGGSSDILHGLDDGVGFIDQKRFRGNGNGGSLKSMMER